MTVGLAALFGRRLVASLSGAVLLFALVNLSLNMALISATGASSRLVKDRERLAAADRWEELEARSKFNDLYADSIGPNASNEQVRRYFDTAFRTRRAVVFDQVMAGYALARNGQVDARTLPPGVYVGARAIGPDTSPLVVVTKYVSNYAFFVRHSFVLVIPSPSEGGDYGRALSFSAGLKSHFEPAAPNDAMVLHATLRPYHLGGYDFPNEGQAIHELYPLSFDPAVIAAAPARLERTAVAIRAAAMGYRPITRNSNTVIGCLLRASGALEGREEAALNDWKLGLRALGIDFDLPLRAALPDPPAFPDLARDCHD